MSKKATRPRPRVQSSRKLGHLWRALYGTPTVAAYGYGVTRKEATSKARDSFRQARGW